MKRYIRSSAKPKILTLDMFDVDEYDFKTDYAEKHCVDYDLDIDGYHIKIYELFGRLPYAITLTYPSGYKGEAGGFKAAQDAVDYLNEKEWWNFKEPTDEQVRRAVEDEWNPPRENYGYDEEF